MPYLKTKWIGCNDLLLCDLIMLDVQFKISYPIKNNYKLGMLGKNIYNSRHNSPNLKKIIAEDIRYNSANLLSSSEEPSDY